MSVTPCIGCGARLPAIEGVTHPYMESSPACWAAFGTILTREYSNPAHFAVHRLTVDTYAVQHPGRPSPRSIQSVALHLISLGLMLEAGVTPARATAAIRAAARRKDKFTWLEPPSSCGVLTVVDVGKCGPTPNHARVVRAWAATTWEAWAEHHATVRAWTQALDFVHR